MFEEPIHGKRIDLHNNSVAWWPCHIGKNTKIGEHVSIGTLAHIGRDVTIGRSTRIQGSVYIADKTAIANHVFIGPSVVILNDKYPPSGNAELWQPVVIEQFAVIGGNSTILPGVKVGEHAVVGAGATVTKSIPKNEVWIGNPATFHMTREEYEQRRAHD